MLPSGKLETEAAISPLQVYYHRESISKSIIEPWWFGHSCAEDYYSSIDARRSICGLEERGEKLQIMISLEIWCDMCLDLILRVRFVFSGKFRIVMRTYLRWAQAGWRGYQVTMVEDHQYNTTLSCPSDFSTRISIRSKSMQGSY